MPQEDPNIVFEIKDNKIVSFASVSDSDKGPRYTYTEKIKGKDYIYDSNKVENGVVKLEEISQQQMVNFVQSLIKKGSDISITIDGKENNNVPYTEANRLLMNIALKNSLENDVIKEMAKLGIDISKETEDKNITAEEYQSIARKYNESANKSEIVKL